MSLDGLTDVMLRGNPPPPPRPDVPDPGYEIGAWVRRDARGRTLRRVWRPLDCAAARWAAPWWALTWLLTGGRQGWLPWEWEEGLGPPARCWPWLHRFEPHTVHYPGIPARLDTVRCTRCDYVPGLLTGNRGTR